jgi:FAD/FMN-containing dehydrogenase
MNIKNAIADSDLDALRAAIAGQVFASDHSGYDQARQAWNLAVDQRPGVVVVAESAADVIQAIGYARAHEMRIAPQGTGHGAAPLEPLDGAMLLRTTPMRQVDIDPATHTARVEAGALWQDVVGPAAEHGLAGLAGSSPNVGVTGYILGGGLGWLARRYGLAANSVTAVELVTPGGDLVGPTPATTRTCCGRSEAAAGSVWSPRWRCSSIRFGSCTPGTCSSRSSAPARSYTRGANGRQPLRTMSPP